MQLTIDIKESSIFVLYTDLGIGKFNCYGLDKLCELPVSNGAENVQHCEQNDT